MHSYIIVFESLAVRGLLTAKLYVFLFGIIFRYDSSLETQGGPMALLRSEEKVVKSNPSLIDVFE